MKGRKLGGNYRKGIRGGGDGGEVGEVRSNKGKQGT